MTTDRRDQFTALLERYNGGIEPLENWETKDLTALEFLINTELQDRYYKAQGEYDRDIDRIDPYWQR